jgi:serine/threonine protein kinase
MLDGRGQVRITDFGLARLAADVVPGEIAGTPSYMVPEQGTRGETTVQSDLYSLGLFTPPSGPDRFRQLGPSILPVGEEAWLRPRVRAVGARG